LYRRLITWGKQLLHGWLMDSNELSKESALRKNLVDQDSWLRLLQQRLKLDANLVDRSVGVNIPRQALETHYFHAINEAHRER
jgi:hypothetical protein